MHRILVAMTTASLLAIPAAAPAADYQGADFRPGAFVGARLRLPLGSQSKARPRAELAVAPTRTRISRAGDHRTQIGDGLALGLSPHAKPTLSLAGMRADRALGLQRGRDVSSGRKLGVSDAGWVAIGVGVIALAAGAYVVHLAVEADKNTD